MVLQMAALRMRLLHGAAVAGPQRKQQRRPARHRHNSHDLVCGTTTEQPVAVAWLHIQMEYCRANLGDVLDREAHLGTEIDDERAWAWGRQILEVLHILRRALFTGT